MTGIFTATIIFLTTAPTGFAHIKWKYYLIFVCITAAMIPCFWFFYPEVSSHCPNLSSSVSGLARCQLSASQLAGP